MIDRFLFIENWGTDSVLMSLSFSRKSRWGAQYLAARRLELANHNSVTPAPFQGTGPGNELAIRAWAAAETERVPRHPDLPSNADMATGAREAHTRAETNADVS